MPRLAHFFALITLALLYLAPICVGRRRIFSGVDPQLQDVSYMVSVMTYRPNQFSHWCGGSILSEFYVLSAAHCYINHTATQFYVKYGTKTPQANGAGEWVAVTQRFLHPNFNGAAGHFAYDLAILQVEFPIKFSQSAWPVVLRSYAPKAGEIVRVIGWGATERARNSWDLLSTYLPVLDESQCWNTYQRYVPASPPFGHLFCAKSDGKGQCDGDSGGPVTIHGEQVGIVSWKVVCGDGYYPEWFTNVPLFRPFIDRITHNKAQWTRKLAG